MKSVLGKLIQQEFGQERYQLYTKKLNNKESMDIFCDIYNELRHQSPAGLNQALKKLLESVQVSIKISKNFWYISLGYFVTVLTLLFMSIPWFVMAGTIGVATICYFYKIVEYLKNKYCDKDVRIVLIYKIALFHLMEEKSDVSLNHQK